MTMLHQSVLLGGTREYSGLADALFIRNWPGFSANGMRLLPSWLRHMRREGYATDVSFPRPDVPDHNEQDYARFSTYARLPGSEVKVKSFDFVDPDKHTLATSDLGCRNRITCHLGPCARGGVKCREQGAIIADFHTPHIRHRRVVDDQPHRRPFDQEKYRERPRRTPATDKLQVQPTQLNCMSSACSSCCTSMRPRMPTAANARSWIALLLASCHHR